MSCNQNPYHIDHELNGHNKPIGTLENRHTYLFTSSREQQVIKVLDRSKMNYLPNPMDSINVKTSDIYPCLNLDTSQESSITEQNAKEQLKALVPFRFHPNPFQREVR